MNIHATVKLDDSLGRSDLNLLGPAVALLITIDTLLIIELLEQLSDTEQVVHFLESHTLFASSQH